MYLICALISIFSTFTATAATIYYVDDGDLQYTWIDITGEQRMEWISVNDRLPKKGVEVLGCYCNEYVEIMQYFGDDDGQILFFQPDSRLIYEVTHWMPLPHPPSFKDGND